jgi:hypothetical protein
MRGEPGLPEWMNLDAAKEPTERELRFISQCRYWSVRGLDLIASSNMIFNSEELLWQPDERQRGEPPRITTERFLTALTTFGHRILLSPNHHQQFFLWMMQHGSPEERQRYLNILEREWSDQRQARIGLALEVFNVVRTRRREHQEKKAVADAQGLINQLYDKAEPPVVARLQMERWELLRNKSIEPKEWRRRYAAIEEEDRRIQDPSKREEGSLWIALQRIKAFNERRPDARRLVADARNFLGLRIRPLRNRHRRSGGGAQD